MALEKELWRISLGFSILITLFCIGAMGYLVFSIVGYWILLIFPIILVSWLVGKGLSR